MPFLSDEPVAIHEDPADRKRRIRSEREQRVYRGVAEQIAIRYSHEDWSRRAHENTTKTADATIRAAVPGENLLTPDAFRAVLELAFPLIDYPKQHRQAKRSGRLQWGGGVVFVRAAE